ncbi:hypothetical protein SuUB81_10030 [Streptococcus uberis]|uniref:hypothetical protein n=1 Tax=Streptococcus uberis TaxID=1349 RepID=UPI003341DD19
MTSWNNERGKQLRVVLFTSRNKDNKNVIGFVERTKAFLTTKTVEELKDEFKLFVEKGCLEETSRFYISVNERNNSKVQKALIHYLLDNEINMASIPSKVASIASKKENSLTNKWLFDFDDDKEKINAFVADVKTLYIAEPEVYETPNGYAVIVEHGFDTRELLKKWDKVELKRDAMLCIYSDKFI